MPKVVPEYKEKARERIVEAAQKVFSAKGYHNTRMEDIAEEVGVSKRTLYIYYENKEELFKAMCAEAPKAVSEMLQSCLTSKDFRQSCADFFNLTADQPPSGLEFEVIAAASRSPALRKIEKDLSEAEIDVISKFLQDLKKQGVLSKSFDAPRGARIMLAVHRGLMADLVLGAKKSEVVQAWVQAMDLIMRTDARK